MSLSQSRAVLRRPQFLFRQRFLAPVRNASTTEVAKEKAGEATSKASEGLSRVSSSANSVASRAGGVVSGLGGGIGRTIGFVQSLIPPTIYYSRVGLELGKMIFETRKMSLPSGAQFQQYFNSALNMLRNPSSIASAASSRAGSIQPSSVLQRVRNFSTADLQGAGIVAAEVIGFFTIGEMLGRLKIVGYRSTGEHAEHH
ncbi:F-type H+-transporting ATPase subunit G [Rhizodiscina lignyota]|uniref:F-type H+-transporting ATPase subunit G n=1 Tax=Rhizodiscina lignyota TaxID=1504668 RepID=A0A9P4I7Z4_9PEZI|nr:F-type H+-transporting ATPase subunit G [Rhizodiscina lignyota]